ncbi:hypothetical protein Tco_1386674 [Tanacetum coccineum]
MTDLPRTLDSVVDTNLGVLHIGIKSQVMSVDFAVTFTFVHFEAQSWSIPSEDPYEEAARQLLEQAPSEDEAPIEAYITEVASAPPPPPSLLPSLIQPPRTRAVMAQMRAAAPSTYHPILPSGTPPLLPIPLPAPSTSRRADIPEADMPPQKRLLLTTPRPGCKIRRVLLLLLRDSQDPLWPVLRREILAYEQESMETCQALARSEAYSRALEARVIVLETQARRHKWQRQDADDRATRHIMRIQALEAGARDDTLEDTVKGANDVDWVQPKFPGTSTDVCEEGFDEQSDKIDKLGRLIDWKPSEMKELSEQLKELSDKGFIRPSSLHSWELCVLVVKIEKRWIILGGAFDYRECNKTDEETVISAPLRIDDLFDQLQGSSVYSKIDLRSGYHQLRVREEDIPKTVSLANRYGLISENVEVMPFALVKHTCAIHDLRNLGCAIPYWINS